MVKASDANKNGHLHFKDFEMKRKGRIMIEREGILQYDGCC